MAISRRRERGTRERPPDEKTRRKGRLGEIKPKRCATNSEQRNELIKRKGGRGGAPRKGSGDPTGESRLCTAGGGGVRRKSHGETLHSRRRV